MFFCAQYINIGTGGADLSSSFFLPKLVGWDRAAEMCMTGERVPAAEAYRIGLVNAQISGGLRLEVYRAGTSAVSGSSMLRRAHRC